MKKITTVITTLILFVSIARAGIIAAPVVNEIVKTENVSPAEALSKLDVQTFLSLTPVKYKEITGKKMTLKEKISLKLAQRHVKKQLKKGNEVNMAEIGKKAGSGISPLWFFLGLLLGIIGLLIALITKKGEDDNRVKSAALGWLVWIIIVIIIAVA